MVYTGILLLSNLSNLVMSRTWTTQFQQWGIMFLCLCANENHGSEVSGTPWGHVFIFATAIYLDLRKNCDLFLVLWSRIRLWQNLFKCGTKVNVKNAYANYCVFKKIKSWSVKILYPERHHTKTLSWPLFNTVTLEHQSSPLVR